MLAIGSADAAQIQIGTVDGAVRDPSHAAVAQARVVLYDTASDFERLATTNDRGQFQLINVPFGQYGVRIEADGFRPHETTIAVRSNLAVTLEVVLEIAGPREELTVRAAPPLVEPDQVSSKTRLDQGFMKRLPGARPGSGMQELVATAPGWATEDNGLLHSRGVDDGFLYVSDGIPLSDRIDTFFSSALDPDAFQTIEILDGHLPVEYGNASGGVINVVRKSELGESWSGTTAFRAGSLQSSEVAATGGGQLGDSVGAFFVASYGGSAERYLDPVDPDNFNNRGHAFRFATRLDWRPTPKDLVITDISANGSAFRVTNTLEQELAGQRQRQELRDDHQSVIWQRSASDSTVTDIGWYRHAFAAELFPSEGDTPISANQDRRHTRHGVLVNLTHAVGAEHVLKAGIDYQHVKPREVFSFFITDEDAAEDAGISKEALAFDRNNPFRFEDAASRDQFSIYFQDTFSLFDRLTINAGLRFDHTEVLVNASALSPRLGAVYFIPQWSTTVRASYNRLFMPPQVENLLLSSSEEARALSPFATEEGDGGAEVSPERQHAFEVGFVRALGKWASLDAVYWRRSVRNYADPNLFFGTTIIFPNSVAEGTASGINVRVDFPFQKGFTGFVSYGNALVYQVGPINGGLFLEEEVIEIGPGTRFIPDHDQRNVGAFGLTFQHGPSGLWAAIYGRHESGTPIEPFDIDDDDDLDEAMERRGAALVDFDRGRVKPRTLFDISLGVGLFEGRRIAVDLQLDIRNLTDRAFAYNFSNPFSGTHFGHPRLVSARVRFSFFESR